MEYYESVQALTDKPKDKLLKSSRGMVPSNDKFLSKFMGLYTSKGADKFKESLIMCLLRAYVAKATGHKNPQYGAKVLNFMLALSATNPIAFSFVSANMCSLSIRHAKKIRAANRDIPLILRDNNDMMRLLLKRIAMIRHEFDDSSMRVAFSVGVDATVVVAGWQVFHSEGKVVGGAYPNQSHDVSGKSKDELKLFLKECVDGKHGPKAAECKIAVISFQRVPPGMSPYFILGGIGQTINDSNDWGKDVMKVCVESAKKAGNAVALNHSTDGVPCEVKWNYDVTISYLYGKSNELALTDTNHNKKNKRYQLAGGSSVASIGRFAFDPWLLSMASQLPEGTVDKPPSKEVIRWTDWASDSLVLAFASPNTVEALLNVDSRDEGNILVSQIFISYLLANYYSLSLLFFRLIHRSLSSLLSSCEGVSTP